MRPETSCTTRMDPVDDDTVNDVHLTVVLFVCLFFGALGFEQAKTQ